MGFIQGTTRTEEEVAVLYKKYADFYEAEECLEKRREAANRFKRLDAKAVGKIGKTCTKTVQLTFNHEWTAKEA